MFVVGTSFIPSQGNQTQKIPPITSVKDNKVKSAAGKFFEPIEYNIRLGVTTTALLLRMLENPVKSLLQVVQNKIPLLQWNQEKKFGCTLTLAGYGYPYIISSVPKLPVEVLKPLNCDLWWNEVDEENGEIFMTNHQNFEMGHRIADINACSSHLDTAIMSIENEIQKIRCLGSYYRLDLKTLSKQYSSNLNQKKQ